MDALATRARRMANVTVALNAARGLQSEGRAAQARQRANGREPWTDGAMVPVCTTPFLARARSERAQQAVPQRASD